MAKKKNQKRDALNALLEAAEAKDLRALIVELADDRPEVRRECVVFLKEHVSLKPASKSTADVEEAWALWAELEPDLSELDEYGGGDYGVQDYVVELLYQLAQKLRENDISWEVRQEFLEEVLPYIKSSNAGLDDDLYEVAYAACKTNEEERYLAQKFETLGPDWAIEHAMRIYRDIGDRDKYLELHALKMKYGMDYYDLSKFYWDAGEKDKAVEVAREGMEKGEGRMDELRNFLAIHAKKSGDRSGYFKLQFEQATDRLTAKKYQEFRKICGKKEWEEYEPRIMAAAERIREDERLKIFMLRKEYDKAIETLSKMDYPDGLFGKEDVLKIAAKLEKRYPEQVLEFYKTGLGNLNISLTRKDYARKATVIKKVRHMWIDIMNEPGKWKLFASQVKEANDRRPAFQQEFAKVVPGWKEL
ncbi:MAG TPA: hypothetical protein PLN69_09990 [bacterium]|nr:hypothetical protein [bacterium]